jgi:hypothetical protein
MKSNPSFSMRPNDAAYNNSIKRYQDSIPGPGNYETNIHRKARSIGFGSGKRTDFVSKDRYNYPGPGAYKIPSKVAEVPPYESKIKPDEFKFI